MLRYYYINKEWMVSGVARRCYRVAACLSLALFFLEVAVRVADRFPIPSPGCKSTSFRWSTGAATTMVAMEYFLFGFDTSSPMKKVFWFCVILLPPLGPPLYCFLVYSRSDVLKDSDAKRVEGASA